MARGWQPHPRERLAAQFRRAHAEWDRARVGRYERAGFGGRAGYRGAYAERPEYDAPRITLHPPGPEHSGWPSPLHHVSRRDEERHLRAQRDHDLARAVGAALYRVLGRAADRITVYAADAVITLEGRLPDGAAARRALEVAWRTPGVLRVRNALSWRER
ncbi:MAG TPA: BON domain-containing protein [Longimicrobiales bacterium]